MSLRAMTIEPSNFVVRFVSDGSVMVRQKVHIVTDGRVRINEVYQVRREETETCAALILAAGGYIAMSEKADEVQKKPRFALTVTSPPSSPPSPASPPPPPPSPAKNLRVTGTASTPRMTPVRRPRTISFKAMRPLTKSRKPAARILGVFSPPDEPQSNIRRPTPSQRMMVQQPEPHQPPTTQLNNTGTPTPATSTPISPSSPVIPSLPSSQHEPTTPALSDLSTAVAAIQGAFNTLETHFGTLMRRVNDLELQQRRLESKVDKVLCRQQLEAAQDQKITKSSLPENHLPPAENQQFDQI